MILHGALGEWHVADEQVAHVDRALVGGKRRAGERHAALNALKQRLGDRSYIAFVGRVEGRAILEEQLPGALCQQGIGAPQRQRDGLFHGAGARLESDHHGVEAGQPAAILGHRHHLDGAHAGTRQHQCEIGGPGQVVSDASQQQGHISGEVE